MNLIVALEGTLTDDSHRFDLKSSSYEDYQNAVGGDKINSKLAEFISKLQSIENFTLYIYSTTPDNLKPKINQLLLDNDIEVDYVLLKKKTDYRSEIDIKISMIESIDNDDLIVVENNMKVADELRAKGIFVLQT